ncbi:MAG: ABC transporter permease [Bryobacteraceae bacterium]|nr:ABC transporter permease [Bryobacteraceae bacterium]
MTRAFELFVAARYLKAKRRQAFISVITVISVLGVAAGVMALVIAIAVNNGFRNSLERNLLGATPHVALLEKEPSAGIENWRELTGRLQALPGVRQASPALYGKVLMSGPMQSSESTLKGMPLDRLNLGPFLREGSIEALREPRTILLGTQLARRTGMLLNSWVTVVSPQGELTPFGPRPLQVRYRVVGLFESGFYDLDNHFAFVTLEAAQALFQTGDVVNALELRIDDLRAAPAIAAEAETIAGPKLGATHWMEQNRQLLGALELEKRVSVITISLIQLIAALNILTALVMSVMEKKRDIAVLVSMGARRAQIARIFIAQGLMIGFTGLLLGLALGYGLSHLADQQQWIALDEEIYSMSYVPFEPRAWDAAWISAMALGVSFLATLYPARAAARIMPVETLRYE